MHSQVIRTTSETAAAEQNRARFRDAGLLAVTFCGDAGAGKTRLIERTLRRLCGRLRTCVVVANPKARRDARVLSGLAEIVVPLELAELDAVQLREALEHVRPDRLDLLLVETIVGLASPSATDLGQQTRVAVFSVSGGDDKASELPRGVADADLVLLSKADLLPHVQFDARVFETDVRRLNLDVPLLRVSSSTGEGMARWEQWLLDRIAQVPRGPAAERIEPPESFLG